MTASRILLLALAVVLATEGFATACPPCRTATPATPFDYPLCQEFDYNSALIDNARHGDRSAIELLEQRYATTFTVQEHFRIAEVLLGRVRDDHAIWSELSEHAERLIVAGGDVNKLEAYSAEHGYERFDYETMAWDALGAILTDRRARPLLLRALASDDQSLSRIGLIGLLLRHDDTALAEIETALRKHPDNVFALAEFHSDAFDALAMKLLKSDSDRDVYREEARASASPSP